VSEIPFLDHADDPVWVFGSPGESDIPPPVETRDQELPFERLSWQNFERLCLRLARTDGDVERCRLFGTQGQEQGGIDIYVSRKSTSKYAVWQSKRHKSFAAAEVKNAVAEFLDGEWAAKSDHFVLCVQAKLRSTDVLKTVEACAKKLAEKGIQFEPIDGEELSLRLKDFHEIVDDFFGREWVRRFCGAAATQALSNRLTLGEMARLKADLHACYASHFAAVDPGVIAQLPSPAGTRISIGLADRYVPPDLWLQQEIAAVPVADQGSHPVRPVDVDSSASAEDASAAATRAEPRLRQERRRIPLEAWLSDTDREVVLGPAGSGKSTLLRFLALDMLSASPAFVTLRRLRPDFIPVWVSFPFWTRLIATDKDRSSLIETIAAWFRRQDEPEMVALVRKALDDKRLLLLVDGVDEWDNETAANTALALLQGFAARRSVPVIVSSRPHGFRLMGGLAGSWRISEIAPLTAEQQIDLARAWFAHLATATTGEQHDARARQQAVDFVAELQSKSAIAQLGATPLLLIGLIALRLRALQLPRNRFLAYAELTKLLLERHPTSRDRAALAGAPRHALDSFTREAALAALAYGIHTGQQGASPDSIEVDQAANVINQCLVQRMGMASNEAHQNARALVTLGEEEIGILVQKAPREVGFFHSIFQEFLAAQYLGGLPFDDQIGIVRTHATDPRWTEVVLCLLYQLQRPNEVDRIIEVIEEVDGSPDALMMRDCLLAEIAFGEFKRSPTLAKRLAEETFVRIETGRWPLAIRRGLLRQTIEGLSSTVLGNRVAHKVSEWFPRWHSYGLRDVFDAMARWPEEKLTARVLWRGLHDEFYDAARVAARTVAARYGGQTEHSSRLLRLVSAPPGFGAAAAGIEALWRGWPDLPELNDVLERARHSQSRLIELAAIRGRVELKSHTDDDFTRLTKVRDLDDYRFNGLVAESLLAGWSGDCRLWDYAVNKTPKVRRRLGPDFWLLLNGFPGNPDLAQIIVDDLSQEYPRCILEHDEASALVRNFKNDPIIIPALEKWITANVRERDAYTIAKIAEVAPTPLIKSLLLGCLDDARSLTFWAASALVQAWGAHDQEVRTALLKSAVLPVSERQNIAHVLPLVMDDKAQCRALLVEIINTKDNCRADFALRGLRQLGINASDKEAANCVFARGYDQERFVLENEVAEVLRTFSTDERALSLARGQLRRDWGTIGTVADVFGDNAEMRREVLAVVAPLDLDLRSAALDQFSLRAAYDTCSRSAIEAARFEEAGDITVGASIALARINKQTNNVSKQYLDQIKWELNAIGPRMDARRQGAFASLVTLERLDGLKDADRTFGVSGLGLRQHHAVLRLVADQWRALAAYYGGDNETLAALGVGHSDFFHTFGDYLERSPEIRALALRLIDEYFLGSVPAAAVKLVERARPASGYLREICFKTFAHTGTSTWSAFSAALTAGEVLSRNFVGDEQTEAELLRRVNADPLSPGVFAAISDGWATTPLMEALKANLREGTRLRIVMHFKLVAAVSPSDSFVEALVHGVDHLQGDLWEAIPHWVPGVIRRLQVDEAAFAQTKDALFRTQSPGMKASFPRLLSRARGLSEELRDWCAEECRRAEGDSVGEVGFDLIAGQHRVVVDSLYDLLAGREG
jgi:hypothetical protein